MPLSNLTLTSPVFMEKPTKKRVVSQTAMCFLYPCAPSRVSKDGLYSLCSALGVGIGRGLGPSRRDDAKAQN